MHHFGVEAWVCPHLEKEKKCDLPLQIYGSKWGELLLLRVDDDT
jgi:hypothetical protein